MTAFEGAIPEIASAFAAEFNISARDATHLLRHEFLKARAAAAKASRQRLENIPEFTEIEIGDGLDADRSADRPDREREPL